MKEAYAVRRTVPPSADIEARIEHMLSVGVGESPRESLSELARLGARLIIQRAVEDEFDAWLGRARYERRAGEQREEPGEESGLRNGFRSRRVQTGEGELEIEIPQVRQAAETFASKLFPRTPKLVRTEPLKALVIGAFVRGLSMRDVESLCEQAGLGKLSRSTASRMCEELKERFERFRRRDLYEIRLVALFLDATFIAVRPDGPKEGVQVAWGCTEQGEPTRSLKLRSTTSRRSLYACTMTTVQRRRRSSSRLVTSGQDPASYACSAATTSTWAHAS
jgi:putative transposase